MVSALERCFHRFWSLGVHEQSEQSVNQIAVPLYAMSFFLADHEVCPLFLAFDI